jgi:FkbM family methyltransferase
VAAWRYRRTKRWIGTDDLLQASGCNGVTESEIGRGPTWRPGRVARLRALARRAVHGSLGDRGEAHLHEAYHRVLRGLGRFGPPEDPETIAVLAALAWRSRTIIDVGANVGRYAWFLKRHARGDAVLFALEPHPGAARLVRAALRGSSRSTVLRLGASDRDGNAALTVPSGVFGDPVSGLAWVQPWAAVDAADAIPIEIRRLDSLIEDGTIPVVGPVLIKIDVEGGEGRVLRGAAEFLGSSRPIIYFECQEASFARQGESASDLWRSLEQIGYCILAQRDGGLVAIGAVDESIVNYLAIPDVPRPKGELTVGGIELTAILDEWAIRTSTG